MSLAYLALGDSYTVGEGVPRADAWPAQLAERLRAGGLDVRDPVVVATTGWTTDELAAGMDAAALAPPYALVTLLVGVNNQYRDRPLDEYRAQFRALLARAVALAGDRAAHVVVVSIPDWGVTPFARAGGHDAASVGRAIDAFNAAARAEAGRAGARFADITGLSRAADLRDLLVADGLHPAGAQYTQWLAAIEPAARAALGAG